MDVPAAIRLCASVCVRADGLTTYSAPLKHQLDFALVPLDMLHTRRRIFYLSVAVDEDRHRFFCMCIYVHIFLIHIHFYTYICKSFQIPVLFYISVCCPALRSPSIPLLWVVKLLLSPSCHKLLLSETASNGEGGSWWQECLMQPQAGNMSTCMCKEHWQKKNIGTLIPAWVALLVEQICS